MSKRQERRESARKGRKGIYTAMFIPWRHHSLHICEQTGKPVQATVNNFQDLLELPASWEDPELRRCTRWKILIQQCCALSAEPRKMYKFFHQCLALLFTSLLKTRTDAAVKVVITCPCKITLEGIKRILYRIFRCTRWELRHNLFFDISDTVTNDRIKRYTPDRLEALKQQSQVFNFLPVPNATTEQFEAMENDEAAEILLYVIKWYNVHKKTFASRLFPPKELAAIRARYFLPLSDPISSWIASCFIIHHRTDSGTYLRDCYQAYAKHINPLPPIPKQFFADELRARGFAIIRIDKIQTVCGLFPPMI